MARDETVERVNSLLREYRIVATALAVLLGFQLQIAFAQGYRDLPDLPRYVALGAGTATLLAFLVLLTPASAQRRATRAIHDDHFLEFVKRTGAAAFVLIALSVTASLWLHAERTFGDVAPATALAAAVGAVAVVLWWVLPSRWVRHAKRHVEDTG